MRPILVLSLSLLATASAVAADLAIPQDLKRIEARRRERLDWQRRTLAGAYEKVGKKDPRWDASARQAMDLAARMFCHEPDPAVTYEEVFKAAKAAIDAGCDDPLLTYLYDRTAFGRNYPGDYEARKRSKATAKAFAESRYPAFRRATGLEVAASVALGQNLPDDRTKAEAGRDYDAVLDLLRESVASDERNEFWEDAWFLTLNGLIHGYRKLGLSAPAALDRVERKLAKLPEVKVLQLQIRGEFWVNYGWEARGIELANKVPEGGFEAMGDRLAQAREALEEAWKLRPDGSRTCNSMLTVAKGLDGDRALMERWFDRAMRSDGDDQEACWSKLDWLDPKWHGTDAEMIAFGRQCRATGNWRAKITLLVADAHYRHGMLLPREEQPKYYGSPEVWPEIKAVYDEYLKHCSTDDTERAKYVALCCLARDYLEAQSQFKALGDRLAGLSHFPYLPRPEMLRMRDEVAKYVNAKLSGITPGKGMAGWIHFNVRHNAGEWSVSLPARPERRQEAGILGTKARNVFTTTVDGVTYTIRVQLIPPAARAGAEPATLDAAREAVVRENDGKIRDEQPATLGERPAREFRVDAAKLRPAILRVRSVVIGERLYELSVRGSEADASGPAATSFLDSFRFQK